MRQEEYRARAQRFLTGKFHSEDLSRLFLFLRLHSYGRQTVHDVGNMVGHAYSRDSGISVRRVSDLYEITRFKLPTMMEHPTGVERIDDAPPRIVQAMESTLRIIDDKALHDITGLNRKQASTRLTRVKRQFLSKPNGRIYWAAEGNAHPKDLALVQCLTGNLISRPAYDDGTLCDELEYLFLRHGFIDSDQKSLFMKRRPHLVLFAIASMHGVKYIMPDSSEIQAIAGWSESDGTSLLHVSASIPATYVNGPLFMSYPIFTTNLQAKQWVKGFSPSLPNAQFLEPIEVTATPRLRSIR